MLSVDVPAPDSTRGPSTDLAAVCPMACDAPPTMPLKWAFAASSGTAQMASVHLVSFAVASAAGDVDSFRMFPGA